MPEASKKIFWPPGGPGGRVIGAAGGPVFLKSAFLVFLVIFLQSWAEIDARSLPKIFFDPRGARGASKWLGSRGASFLKICILVIFGDIFQTWTKIDAQNSFSSDIATFRLLIYVVLWLISRLKIIIHWWIYWLKKDQSVFDSHSHLIQISLIKDQLILIYLFFFQIR